ncbi:MAG: PIG-L family deacetylase [Thermoanaerobaculia bacterium]|jgi:LmbE family N-acetylglucosaminyl deacetylase|nr:PIG-L family deacetylase [Thermoanaerobaculia bacterium]
MDPLPAFARRRVSKMIRWLQLLAILAILAIPATTPGILAALSTPGILDPLPTPHSPPLFPGVQSVLWVAAHPDDEVLVAPAIAKLCRLERLACHFLVLTRGEAGVCLRPEGCLPDLATVRTQEMQQAAALFGAELTLWTLPDGGGLAGWDAASGGHGALVTRLEGFLRGLAPDLILTFDPRHGATCHGDHRAAGELLLAARDRLDPMPATFLLETLVEVTAAPPFIRYSPAAGARAGTFGYTATPDIAGVPGTWSYSVAAARLHRSQFSAATVRALARRPGVERVVYLAPAEPVLADDNVATCP